MIDQYRQKTEEDIQACYATWGERYYSDYYEAEETYPATHVDLVRSQLLAQAPKRLLDVGCGPASMLRQLIDLDIDLFGFDLTAEMVAEGKRIFASYNLSPEAIWQGSALDKAAYGSSKYDVAISFGVLPHIPADHDRTFLDLIRMSLSPGGVALMQARNELFSLFTLNRPTSSFMLQSLVDIDGLIERHPDRAEDIQKAREQVEQQLRMDLPPIRAGYADEPGYDQVLSRVHNPFVLSNLAREVGFTQVETLFYHYHVMPPLASGSISDLYQKESLALEKPDDWRGHFMASSFVIKAIR